MKSYFLSCPVCNSLRQEILFPGFNKSEVDSFQNIVLCQDCGSVFRNPIIPELNRTHYQKPNSWEGEKSHIDHSNRLDFVSRFISHNVKLGVRDSYVDIGGGPGWLVKKMRALHPDATIILCEPSPDNCRFAKEHTPDIVAIPSRIDEITTPERAFSLITATGVDYLFIDHRSAMQKIAAMLRDDGYFYIERNVFVDQEAYYSHPILDHDDLFGDNHMMNFWPNRELFVQYVSEFFDVIDKIDYHFGETLGRKCQMLGLLCTKKRAASGGSPHGDYYEQNLKSLQQRAILSSIEDLTFIAKAGLGNIAILGDERQAAALRRLIEENHLFALPPADAPVEQADAVLIASVSHQQALCDRLRSSRFRGHILPCFRPGLPFFEAKTSSDNIVQLKAFLPAYLAGLRAA